MHFLDTILSILFPAKCAGCGRNGNFLCLECLKGCPSAERESAEWIFPLFDYRHPVIKKSLWLLKYKGKKGLTKIFAEVLYDKMLEELADLSAMENFRDPVLIPIPLSPKRLRERGFNQAELICKEIAKVDNIRLSAQAGHGVNIKLEPNILFKPKDTEHQARIKDRKERLRNMQGTFSVENEEIIKSQNIILIDDIVTTGATLSEARKVLREAGARKVIAFTVAH